MTKRHTMQNTKEIFLLFICTFSFYTLFSQRPENVIIENSVLHYNICFGSSKTLVAPLGDVYLWSTGATSQSIQVSPSATTIYSVRVTNEQLNVTIQDYNVVVIPKPTLFIAGSSTLCAGTSIELNAITENNGSNISSFLWSTGAVTPYVNVSPPAPTIYSVVIKDFYGCTNSASTSIEVYPSILQNAVITDASCFGAFNGSISLTMSSGTSPFKYDWDDINGTDDPKDRLNLKAGNYKVIVTDAKNCSSIGYYTIQQPSPLNVSSEIMDTKCTPNTGSIVLNPGGGNFPYTFDWADITGSANIKDRSSLSAGTYLVTISDLKGCSLVKSFTIDAPSAPVVTGSTIQINCAQLNSGAISLSVSGGMAPYQYFWSDLNGAAGPEDRTGLIEGPYSVSVVDANNCSAVYSTTLTVDNFSKPFLNSVSVTQILCHGSNNGSINLFPVGTYTYDWDDLAGAQNIQNRTDLAPGTYHVTITNSLNCSIGYTALITQPILLQVFGSINSTSCGLTNGTITLQVTGGSSPYSFDWQDQTGVTNTKDRTGLAPGNYEVLVKDAAGCLRFQNFTILSSQNPEIVLDTVNHVTCFNGVTGTIKFVVYGTSPEGSSKPFLYDWDDIRGGDDVRDRSGLKAGTYKVTVTDHYGCIVKKAFTLTQPSSAIKDSAVVIPTSCDVNSGSISLILSGGVAPFTYDWLDVPGPSNSKDRTGLAGATYQVIIKDQVGCQITKNFVLNAPSAPVITSTINQISCAGLNDAAIDITAVSGSAPFTYDWLDLSGVSNSADRINLLPGIYELKTTDSTGCFVLNTFIINVVSSISIASTLVHVMTNNLAGEIDVTASGGKPPYRYDWADVAGNDNTEDRTNLLPGQYQLTITDGGGCQATLNITINSSLSGLTIIDSILHNKCHRKHTGKIKLAVVGGIPPYSYDWSDLTGSSNPRDRDSLTAGTYSVIITDVASQRKKYDFTITEPKPFELDVSITDSTSTQTGSIHLNLLGGTSPYLFDWQDVDSNNNEKNRNYLQPGIYPLTIIDQQGCSIDTIFYINADQLNLLKVNADIHNVRCNGQSNGSIVIDAFGGKYPYQFDWVDLIGSLNEPNRKDLKKGFYTVLISDKSGQKLSKTYEVKEPDTLSFSFVSTIAANLNGSITIMPSGGNPPYAYDWKDIQGYYDAPHRTGLRGGNYFLQLRDSMGCTYDREITVDNGRQMRLKYTLTHPSCPGASDGVIKISSSQYTTEVLAISWIGASGYAYRNQEFIKGGLSAGTYLVQLYPALGYGYEVANFYVELKDPTHIEMTETHNRISCRTPLSGFIDLTIQGGTAPYIYKWNDGPTTQDRTQVKAGTYKVNVTDSKGCKDSLTNITTYSFNVNGKIIEQDTCVPTDLLFGPDTSISIDDTNPCMFIGIDIGPEFCYSWEPSRAFEDPYAPIQYVCPEEGESYTLYIATSDSLIKSVTYSMCKVDINLTNEDPIICSASSIKLDVAPTFVSYKWYNSKDSLLRMADTVTVYKSGRYTVRVVDDIGCVASKDIYVKENCGLICTEYTMAVDPDGAFIRQRINEIGTSLGINIAFYLTNNLVALQSSGSRRITNYDGFGAVKTLFANQSFNADLGIWLHYNTVTKKLCYLFKYSKVYEDLLKGKFDYSSDFSEYISLLEQFASNLFENRALGLDGDIAASLAESGALSYGGLGKSVQSGIVPCSLYDNCNTRSCRKFWTPVTSKFVSPMMAGMVDELIKQGVDITQSAKSIALGTIKLLCDEKFRFEKISDIVRLVGSVAEKLPSSFAEINKNIKELGIFIVSGLNLADNAIQTRLNIYNKINSADPCESVEGGYQIGKDITIVSLNFIPIGVGKSATFSRVQILLAKFYKISPLRIARWRQAGTYFKVLIKDIQSQSDEFLNYILSLPGNPKAYDVLQAHTGLRVDLDLLRNLDLFLKDKSPDEIAKIRQLINEASDDKARRRILNSFVIAGKIYKNVPFDQFAMTFVATLANQTLAYNMWGEDRFEDLYNLFKNYKLNFDIRINDVWPPFYGFKSILKVEKGSQLIDKIYDRFQGPGDISGTFASPVNGIETLLHLHFTYDSRALSSTIKEGTNYIKFKIKSNILPDLTFEYGDVIPWFNKQGLGDQVKSSIPFNELWNDGAGSIEIIEHLVFKNGMWKPK